MWERLLDPRYLPLEATILLMWGLAALLLRLDFNKPAHRAMAAFLVFRGLTTMVGLFRGIASAAGDVSMTEYWQRVSGYTLMPGIPALAYFAAVYPRRRTWLGRSRWGGWATLGFIVVLELAYLWDHSLLWSYSTAPASAPYLQMAGPFAYTGFGPLILFHSLVGTAMMLVAFVFLHDAVREKVPTSRFSVFLVFAGVEIAILFTSTNSVLRLVDLFRSGDPYPWFPWGWAYALGPVLAFLLALAAVGVVIAVAVRTSEPGLRRLCMGLLVVVPLEIASLLALDWAGTGSVFADPKGRFVLGIYQFAFPALVTYGLVRYQVFDADARVKFSIRQGVVLAFFGAVFFGASEAVEFFVSNAWGTVGGLLAAAAMTVAIRPLERAAGGLAERIMPNTRPLDELSAVGKQQMFWDQVALAVQDGQLTAREQQTLRALQRRLGLPEGPLAKPAVSASTQSRKPRK